MRLFVKLAVLAMPLCGASAHAASVYSNLGPGDSYDSSGGLTVANNFTAAGSFQPSLTALLDSIDLGLNYNQNVDPNGRQAMVSLAADQGGSPGNLIETVGTANAVAPYTGTGSGVVSVTSSTHSQLVAGTTYWIVLSAGPGNDDVWKTNIVSDVNRGASKHASDAWIVGFSNPGFRVNASVPEPNMLASLLLLGGVTMLRRRARRGNH
jgi:hypothetical protein